MKNQIITTFMLLGFLIAFLPKIIAQDVKIITCGKTNKPNNVLVANGDLMKFARGNYALNVIPHLEQPELVKLSRNQWQLVAHSSDHLQVFSFALNKVGKKLLLLPTGYLNVCACRQGESFEGVPFEDIFIVSDNKPIGCKGGNHTIAGRN